MKRFLPSLVVVLLFVNVSFGQAPKGINYQGVARDNEGNPYASKAIAVRISILTNSATGTVEYAETHKPQTNQFGLFTLVIGKGTIVTGDFAFISWAVGNKWLQIEIDPNGGSSYTVAGTQQLMTVPYAYYAEYAGNSTGLAAGTGIAINSGVISNTGDGDNNSTNELQNLSEVLTKSNNAGGIKITNLGTPIDANDAATKSYVDTQNALDLDQSATNEIQDLALNSTTNILNITNNTSATPINLTPYKQTLTYTPATNNLAISGGNNVTISTTLNQTITNGGATGANGNRIQNMGAPTSPNDATTKSYVDNAIARNFAFKVNFNFLNNTGAVILNQIVPLSATEDFDVFNVIALNRFTAQDAGIYVFTVEGSYQYPSPSAPSLYLVVNGIQNPVAIISPVGGGDPKYNTTLMFSLTAGQTATLFMDFIPNTARIVGNFFGFKL